MLHYLNILGDNKMNQTFVRSISDLAKTEIYHFECENDASYILIVLKFYA